MLMLLRIDPRGWTTVHFSAEVCGCLVAPAVFKTDVAEHLGQAGSIPVRLRQRNTAGVWSLLRAGYAAAAAADRIVAHRCAPRATSTRRRTLRVAGTAASPSGS